MAAARASTSSWSARARRAARSPTGSRPTRTGACSCSRPAAAIATPGSTCRSATTGRSSTRSSAWGYQTEPEPGLNGRRIPWPRGKVLGGSSSINGLVYIRGQKRGLRSLAPARQRRLVLSGRPALLQARRGPAAGRRRAPRRGRPARGRRQHAARALRGLCARRRGARHPAQPRLQRRRAGRRRLLPADHAAAAFAARPRPPTCARPGSGPISRSRPAPWCSGSSSTAGARPASATGRRRAAQRAGPARDHPRGRRDQLAADPACCPASGRAPICRPTASRWRTTCPASGSNLQDHFQARSVYRCTRPITLNDRVRSPLQKLLMGVEWALFRTGPLTIGAAPACDLRAHPPRAREPGRPVPLHPVQRRPAGPAPAPVPGLHRRRSASSAPRAAARSDQDRRDPRTTRRSAPTISRPRPTGAAWSTA